MIPPLPSEVTDWLVDVFRSCNERTSAKLTKMPTEHEPSLDFTLIEHLSQFSAPFKFSSDWVIRLQTHFLGGRSFFYGWEIADIGLLVMFRRAGTVVLTKVALLQSKRLYPGEQQLDEDRTMEYRIGFGRLLESDAWWASAIEERTFGFTEQSEYKALKIGDNQYEHIAEYESTYSIPVHYLLYNPWHIPWSVEIPIRASGEIPGECEVGCRVLPASELRAAMVNKERGAPSYHELETLLGAPFTSASHRAGWRLEHFVVDLLMGCHAGYIANSPRDSGLEQVFYGRSAPISAAISITIDAPEQ